MPALVIAGQKRAGPATTQPPTKRAWLDVRAEPGEDMVSSVSTSAATSILQEPEDEDLWDDRMGYEASADLPTVSPEPVAREDAPQKAPEEVPRTGAGSRVAMTFQDRLLQDCWLNWEEDVRWVHRDWEMARGIIALYSRSGVAMGHVHGRRLSEEEEARFTMWKRLYVGQLAGFEEERLAMGGFGLDNE